MKDEELELIAEHKIKPRMHMARADGYQYDLQNGSSTEDLVFRVYRKKTEPKMSNKYKLGEIWRSGRVVFLVEYRSLDCLGRTFIDGVDLADPAADVVRFRVGSGFCNESNFISAKLVPREEAE